MEFTAHSRINRSIDQAYSKNGSGILVLYGEYGLGKTRLLTGAIERFDNSYYYQAVPASSLAQCAFMGKRWANLEGAKSYEEIFEKIEEEGTGKIVLFLDEFDYLLKADDTFINALILALSKQNRNYLVVLCTSSLGFVSGTMSKKLGKAALYLQGLLKVKDYSFTDMQTLLPDLTSMETFYRYALMGGRPFPMLLSKKYSSMRDMIIGMFLQPDGYFYDYGIRYISEHLREPGVYSTILYLIAKGNCKLNDLYRLSAFSRAKISVYLKNLIELDLVEKVYSFGAAPRDDSLKGVYRICNPMVHFWYRFIYENRCDVDLMDADDYFDRYILDGLDSYLEYYYGLVASRLIAEGVILDGAYPRCFEWIGKSGNIPVIATPKEGGGKAGEDAIVIFTCRSKALNASFLSDCLRRVEKAGLKSHSMMILTEAGTEEGTSLSVPGMNLSVRGYLS